MQVGTRVNTRTVSRARYEKMLQEELTRINETLTSQAKQIKIKKRLGNTNAALASPLVSYEEIRKSRKRVPSRARFRVFRALRAMGYTFPSIAAASQYDHTSIIHGIRRLNAEEPVLSTMERPAVNATPCKNVSPAELTGRATDFHQPLASIEIIVGAVAA